MKSYAVLINKNSIYIKDCTFFKEQGGLKEKWGKNWVRIRAENGDDARRRGFIRRDGKVTGTANYLRHLQVLGSSGI